MQNACWLHLTTINSRTLQDQSHSPELSRFWKF